MMTLILMIFGWNLGEIDDISDEIDDIIGDILGDIWYEIDDIMNDWYWWWH